QEELKRLEEQDNKKESENKLGALSGLYKNLLDTREKIYKATIIKGQGVVEDAPAERVEVEEEDLSSIISKKNVELNDDNEVIDRRQLLSAGLNVTKKRMLDSQDKDSTLSAYDEFVQRRAREQMAQKVARAEAQRHRLTQQLHAQLREKETEHEKQQAKTKQDFATKMARRNDDNAILDARARYLARKKEAQTNGS
ncbi:hypothetical protein L0F63_007405, partial [Massospora cicadina]